MKQEIGDNEVMVLNRNGIHIGWCTFQQARRAIQDSQYRLVTAKPFVIQQCSPGEATQPGEDVPCIANETSLRMVSGAIVDIANFKTEDVDPYCIAFALSNLCCYQGHIAYYSLAQRAVLTSRLLRMRMDSPGFAIEGLFHEAYKAYVGALDRKIESLLPEYWEKVASPVDLAIRRRFNLPPSPSFMVRKAKQIAQAVEMQLLPNSYLQDYGISVRDIEHDIPDLPLFPLPPDEAAAEFLEEFSYCMHIRESRSFLQDGVAAGWVENSAAREVMDLIEKSVHQNELPVYQNYTEACCSELGGNNKKESKK